MKGIEIKIKIDENGQMKCEYPDGMAPMALLGCLDFAKSIVTHGLMNPQPTSPIVAADEKMVQQLKVAGRV